MYGDGDYYASSATVAVRTRQRLPSLAGTIEILRGKGLFALVAAGLRGGKGVPEEIGDHPVPAAIGDVDHVDFGKCLQPFDGKMRRASRSDRAVL